MICNQSTNVVDLKIIRIGYLQDGLKTNMRIKYFLKKELNIGYKNEII